MKMMLFLLCVLLPVSLYAQGGGKAEPNRIEFAAGSSSKVLTGSLSNGQEMEYVFAATKGQHVTIRNATRGLFDFRLFSDEFSLETEFDSSPALTIVVAETGDYFLYVRKKMVKKPRRARFSVTLTIK